MEMIIIYSEQLWYVYTVAVFAYVCQLSQRLRV